MDCNTYFLFFARKLFQFFVYYACILFEGQDAPIYDEQGCNTPPLAAVH